MTQLAPKVTRQILLTPEYSPNPHFTQTCEKILQSDPAHSEWYSGDGMWSWANEYLYDPYPKAQEYLRQHYRYKYGQGKTAWYIVDADTLKMLDWLKKEK